MADTIGETLDFLQIQIGKKLPEISKTYEWRTIPEDCPISWQQSASESENKEFEDNLRLRSALHENWNSQPLLREKIARWYVVRWGGVTRGGASIQPFVATISKKQLPERLGRVASWSKICAISDPMKYAIYDKRVCFALNAMQFLEKGRIDHKFALPPGRNSTVECAAQILENECNIPRANSTTSRIDYDIYIELMRRFDTKIQHAEMTLFMAALPLAKKVMDRVNLKTDSGSSPSP